MQDIGGLWYKKLEHLCCVADVCVCDNATWTFSSYHPRFAILSLPTSSQHQRTQPMPYEGLGRTCCLSTPSESPCKRWYSKAVRIEDLDNPRPLEEGDVDDDRARRITETQAWDLADSKGNA
ncbi:hypothetical protein NLJ89_g8632 [Agrocybe chaxingu]|uniref:Uncharacterized protein n=1 Tax=Agrocybe chaxingu TaxID=84603 RepID=A0A9W8MUB2_9AGAR|nr:hypothetical protein NLJ89_g8632 [Agrocybe chaxingu]